MGMVLTLIIVCDEKEYAEALAGQHGAGREHPARILLVVTAGGPDCRRSTPRCGSVRARPARWW